MTLVDLTIVPRRGINIGSSDVTVTDPVNAAAATNLFQAEMFHNKRFYFRSTLNQTVTLTLRSYKSHDATDPRAIGSPIVITAGDVTPQTSEVHITEYHPFIDVQYDPAADATGSLVISFRAQQNGG